MRTFSRADGRVYSIFSPSKDLLGDWVVVTVHGSTRSRLGGIKIYPSRDLDSAKRLELEIARLRIRHGYVEQRSEVGDVKAPMPTA